MYYGINAKTGNMIMLDRKRARCPNGLKLGTPGSGKSMSCKSEILSVFLCTPDDVYICDPEAEYYPLVKRLHGQVVKLSPTSKNYVNPLDINLNYSEDENPLALKSDFVLSFCELVMGGKNGLEAIEKTVIDRAVQVIYRPYLADPKPENMPILADLHKALLDQHIPEADRVAQLFPRRCTPSCAILQRLKPGAAGTDSKEVIGYGTLKTPRQGNAAHDPRRPDAG